MPPVCEPRLLLVACCGCRRVKVEACVFEERPAELRAAEATEGVSHTFCPNCMADVLGISLEESLCRCRAAETIGA
jgi:hypothetical protein